MPYKNRRSSYSTFILIFVALKIVLNLFAISNFGFHRDELLHLVLGDHLVDAILRLRSCGRGQAVKIVYPPEPVG